MPAKRGRKAKAGDPAPPAADKAGPAPIPGPPGHLEGLEVDAWRSCCSALAARGTLEAADLAIVEAFAVAYAMGRRIREQLRVEPLTTKCPGSGRTYMNPLIAASADSGAKVRALLTELGLTPRSRRAAPSGGGGAPDALDRFLDGD